MENDDVAGRGKRKPRRSAGELPISEVGRTCGQCVYWDSGEGGEVGECFLNPPTVVILEEYPCSIRPQTEHDERACSHFRGCQ